MNALNHLEIERELLHTLKNITVDNDFTFNLPLEFNSRNEGITFGVGVNVAFYSEIFYFQIFYSDFKKTNFIQVGFKLLIGEITVNDDTYKLVNELNNKLLYAKAVVSDEIEVPFLTLNYEFSIQDIRQTNDAIYDFLNDLIDDDVTPVLEKIIKTFQ